MIKRFVYVVCTLFSVLALSSVYAQGNPTLAACGLPTEGSITAAVTYTLTANCTQTGTLSITAPNVTIVGAGFTIDASAVLEASAFKSFPNRIFSASDLTIVGGGSNNVATVHMGGSATLTNISFRDSKGSAFYGSSGGPNTYTLENILIEGSRGGYFYYGDRSAGLGAANGSTINVSNLVMRDIYGGNSAISAQSDSTVTISGCFSAERIFPQLLGSHNQGTLTNNSTGPCSGTIGNGDSAVSGVPPPAPAACGLPVGGYLAASGTYTLSGDCQQTSLLLIPKGLTVTINGNGHKIIGSSLLDVIFSAGNFTVRKVEITGAGRYPIRTYQLSSLTVDNVIVRNNAGPLLIIDAQASVRNVLFENNVTTAQSASSGASALRVLRRSDLLLENTIFRNNSGGAGALFTGEANPYDASASVTLTGCISWEGNAPANIADPNSLLSDNSTGPCGQSVTNLVAGAFTASASAASASADAGQEADTDTSWTKDYEPEPVSTTAKIYRRQEGSDTAMAIYGVNEKSQGYFILSVTQSQVDALAGAGVVAVSADGTVLVVKWPDGNVTVKIGPDAEGKIFHITYEGGLGGRIIGTITTYGPPPGLPYLSNFGHAPQSTSTEESALQGCQVTNTDYVNFRRVPGGAIIAVLTPGYTLSANARTGGWFKVSYDGISGWISAGYVTTQGACA